MSKKKVNIGARSTDLWERFYEEEDPWSYLTSSYERKKYYRQTYLVEERVTPKSILEIGCSEGAHTAILAEKFPNSSITALDISSTAVSRAIARLDGHKHVKVLATDLVTYLQDTCDGPWDVIFWSESIRYFGQSYPASELYRIIRLVSSSLAMQGVLCSANKVRTVEDPDSEERFTLFQAYRTLLSRTMKPIHSSRYSEFRDESRAEHEYEIWLFEKIKGIHEIADGS